MKPGNFILQLFGFSFNTGNIRNSYSLNPLVIALLVFTSPASYAGKLKPNSTTSSFNDNYHSVLKATASPLTPTESIRSNLYLLNANNTTILADGVLTEYSNLYHDSVYLEDAYKFTNITENLGLIRYGAVLSVERRPIISVTDTLFFKLWKTTRRNYQLEFVTGNLDHPGMQAFLEDSYLGTSTLLSLNGTTKINFSINTDVGSANVNRFRIVYKTNLAPAILPVTFTSVRGYVLNNKISISWEVENEINIEEYEIERSANVTDFIMVNSTAVAGLNNTYNRYSWIDDNPLSGNNFYRINSVDRKGSKKFSIIIKVTTGKTGAGSITVYPNPIKGNMVNVQLINQPIGIYQVRLINNTGQLMYCGRLAVSSGNISHTLFTTKKLAGGIYQLEIKAPDNKVQIRKAIFQE